MKDGRVIFKKHEMSPCSPKFTGSYVLGAVLGAFCILFHLIFKTTTVLGIKMISILQMNGLRLRVVKSFLLSFLPTVLHLSSFQN